MSKTRIRLDGDPLRPTKIVDIGPFKCGYQWIRTRFVDHGSDFPDRPGSEPKVGRVLVRADHTCFFKSEVNVLAEPELFRVFAATETDASSILDFANRYGQLGESVQILDLNEPVLLITGAESQERWHEEILKMRHALRVWDAYCAGETELKKVVRSWDELSPAERMIWWGGDKDRPGFDWFAPEYWDGKPAILHPYSHFDHLSGGGHKTVTRREAARGMLAYTASPYLTGFCGAELAERERLLAQYKMQVRPLCILGAVWWQFVRLLTEEATYRPCRMCGRPMEISTGPHGGRTNREFCTDACKLKDHRRKVREAKALSAEGKSVKKIARHLGTTPDVIGHWLTKKK